MRMGSGRFMVAVSDSSHGLATQVSRMRRNESKSDVPKTADDSEIPWPSVMDESRISRSSH